MGKFYFLAFVVLCIVTTKATGQQDLGMEVSFTLPETALVRLQPNNSTIQLALTPPSEAGARPQVGAEAVDRSKWINYTSAITEDGPLRRISAELIESNLPEGISLTLEATPDQGSGAGRMGIPSGRITLSESPRTIISQIGGAYTGAGTNRGHQLIYSLQVNDWSKIPSTGAFLARVLFTITD